MGNYNADENFNLPQMATLSRAYSFIPAGKLLSDQWSRDSAHRVSSFHDGTGLHKLHIAFDPRVVPS